MSLLRPVLVVIAAIMLVQYSPSLLNFEPKFHDIPFPHFEGPYAPNDLMDKSQRIHEGILPGPEALIVGPDGHIYTGLANGLIVRLVGSKIEEVAKTGIKDCSKKFDGHTAHTNRECGRPLGIRFGKDGLLYVADAFSGLITVDIETGEVTELLSLSKAVGGKNLTFPDDLDIDKNGNIYFSDASTKWGLEMAVHALLERQTDGRIIKYDPRKRKAEVVVDGIAFANGVQLSSDESSLLICECSLRRVIRYYLKGKKSGKTEIFVDQLPGNPDNIRPSRNGGYWVAVISPRSATDKRFFDTILDYPVVLRLVVRVHHLIGSALEFIGNKLSCNCVKDWAQAVQNSFWGLMDGKHCMVVELDSNGKLIRSLSAPASQCGHISNVLDHNGHLYFGSFVNNYLTTLKL